jgi:hypothetical protein
MLINIIFDEEGTDLDIIDVPEFIAKDIGNIQQLFFDWLYDEPSPHNYWIWINDIKTCVYNTNEFVEWVNNNYLNDETDETDEKVRIVSKNLTELNYNNPTIYF